MDLPAHPLPAAVRAEVEVLLAPLDGTLGEATGMDAPPALRRVGQHVVMTAAHDLLLADAEIIEPAVAGHEVAHLGIEHGDSGRHVAHEEAQRLLLVLA